MSILAELTKRIGDSLTEQGLEVKNIGYKDLIDGQFNATVPAVNVVINGGEAKLLNNVTYNWRAVVSLLLVVSYAQSETVGDFKRKEGMYKLIEAISDYLILHDFGLSLTNRMIPKKFKNITKPEWAKAGYQVYNLEFWISYNTVYESPEDISTGPLNEILVKNFLEPDAGIPPTGDPINEDLINLQ
jgi:hypothetical protein